MEPLHREQELSKSIVFTFEDTGDTWEIVRYLTVKQQRGYTTLAASTNSLDPQEPDLALLEEITKLSEELIILCTLNWSYGPVDLETLHDKVYGHHYVTVSERMGDLYIPLVEMYIKSGLKGYSSLLNQVEEISSQ